MIRILPINKPKIMSKNYTVTGLNENVVLDDPYGYLIRCHKFAILKDWTSQEGSRAIEDKHLFLILSYTKDNLEEIEWAYSKFEEFPFDEFPRMFSWLLNYSHIKGLKFMDDKSGYTLVQKEIKFLERPPEDRQYQTLLHDAIV
mmetsp:Transcript_9923/g.9812  ORF Transcript_9923/g.9812 Transcript_9923/m.9812 type:complete len:144 (+) Transcript_9923:1381-1812(+)